MVVAVMVERFVYINCNWLASDPKECVTLQCVGQCYLSITFSFHAHCSGLNELLSLCWHAYYSTTLSLKYIITFSCIHSEALVSIAMNHKTKYFPQNHTETHLLSLLQFAVCCGGHAAARCGGLHMGTLEFWGRQKQPMRSQLKCVMVLEHYRLFTKSMKHFSCGKTFFMRFIFMPVPSVCSPTPSHPIPSS